MDSYIYHYLFWVEILIEYPSICYLQNQKTGCTFVEEFLRFNCKENIIRYGKHNIINQYIPKFYFINVRKPESVYQSLFNYGRNRSGAIFYRLCSLDREYLYRDINYWLEFMLDNEKSPLIEAAYTNTVSTKIGFVTWRFFRLSCYGFEWYAPHNDNLNEYIEHNFFMNSVVKQENLRQDLINLVENRIHIYMKDIKNSIKWINNIPDINTSSNIKHKIDPDIQKQIKIKEKLLYDRYYFDD